MNGETETGITTFFLKHEIDTGDIIARRSIPIADEDNAGTIHDKLMVMGADMVAQTVRDIENGTLSTSPQPEGEFIPAPKIFKEDCLIDWNRPAREIHNQIRGLSPYPAAYSTLTDENGKTFDVKIFESRVLPSSNSAGTPGKTIIDGKKLFVVTGDGMIEILLLQPAGKKRMDTASFLLGYHPSYFSVAD